MKKRGMASASKETRLRVSRSGGLAISRNPEHMSGIGRIGGASISKDTAHMSEIGKKGGATKKNYGRRYHLMKEIEDPAHTHNCESFGCFRNS